MKYFKKSSGNPNVDAPKNLHASAFEHRKVFVVVDGISTGKHIAPFLRGNGYDVVHVQSNSAKSLGLKHNEYDYIESYEENDSLVESLKNYDIQEIIPGAEAGVQLADALNEALKLPYHNDFSKREARQDKYLMHEAIKRENLRSLNQIKVDNLDELLKWVKTNGYPVVLKPVQSAGTDNVHFCYEETHIIAAFEKIMASKNVHGNQNQSVVAQEMLIGDEYMVNTVSRGDDICISDIIAVKKKVVDNAPLYDYSFLLSPKDPKFSAIFQYVSQVLKATGFTYGAAHTEVIWTKNGPTLVEINPRLTGAYDMATTTEATGRNHVSVLVKSLIREGYVARQSKKTKEHPKHTLTSFFIAEEGGEVINDPDFSTITSNSLVYSVKFPYAKGSTIKKTTSLMNSPGMVNLVGDNEQQLLEAHQEFRKQETAIFKRMLGK